MHGEVPASSELEAALKRSLPMFSQATAPTEHAPTGSGLLLPADGLHLTLGELSLSSDLGSIVSKWVQWQENTDKQNSLMPFQGERRGFCPLNIIHKGTFVEHLWIPE